MNYDGRVNIYIKQADRAKWEAIPNKPDWLHNHLNEEGAVIALVHQHIEQAKADVAKAQLRELGVK